MFIKGNFVMPESFQVFPLKNPKLEGKEAEKAFNEGAYCKPFTVERIDSMMCFGCKDCFFGNDETKECAIGMENCDRSYIYMAREESERKLPSKLQEYNKNDFSESELEAPADSKEWNVPGVY